MLVVHHVFRPDTSLQILEVGSLLPLHATALGKAVLAYLDEERRGLLADELPADGPHLGTAAARRDLELFASAATPSRTRKRCSARAASLHRSSTAAREAVGAIGVVGPARAGLAARPRQEARARVIEAARGISRDLGAARWPASG